MQLLSTAQVLERCSIPRSSFFFWRTRGEFPAPIRINARVVMWREDLIDDWMRERSIVRRVHRDP